MLHVLSMVVALGLAYPETMDLRFDWTYQGASYSFTFRENGYRSCKAIYEQRSHVWDVATAVNYVQSDPCFAGLKFVAEKLKVIARNAGLGRKGAAELALNFVRSIRYSYDRDSKNVNDFVRFAYETVLDQTGDCEDHAILYAAILSLWCMDCVLIRLPTHVAVGLRTDSFQETGSGTYYTVGGQRFYYCEATGCKEGQCGEAAIGENRGLNEESKSEWNADYFVRVPPSCSVTYASNAGD